VSDAGRVSYARALDGAHLAYRVSGSGPLDVLEVGGFGTLFSMDACADQPRWQRFEDDLNRFCRLIRFDWRGIGLSDRLVGPIDVDQWVGDALTVLDAAGSRRAAVLGTGLGAAIAVALAAAHPDRVDALVLANPLARVMEDVDYPIGASRELFAGLAAGAVPDGNIGDDIDVMAPSVAHDAEVRRWWSLESRRGASPASASAIWDFIGRVDVRREAAALALPTLVLRTVGNQFVPAVLGGWLADHIPDARLVDIAEADHVLWAIPGDQVLSEIEEFLTGGRDRSGGRHDLASILFTDIVGSTARNAAEGNAAWLDRLSRHDVLVTQEIRRFGGSLVKGMGDGVLATFSTPSLALRCARAINTRLADLGIAVRAAVHAAEVERRGDDVLGLGVTIAARVLSQAGPGEILTTSTVAELLMGSAFRFAPRGSHDLKGVPGRWTLFALE
jgi:class 3 adenylate cyclase